jgi:hypothetical protein
VKSLERRKHERYSLGSSLHLVHASEFSSLAFTSPPLCRSSQASPQPRLSQDLGLYGWERIQGTSVGSMSCSEPPLSSNSGTFPTMASHVNRRFWAQGHCSGSLTTNTSNYLKSSLASRNWSCANCIKPACCRILLYITCKERQVSSLRDTLKPSPSEEMEVGVHNPNFNFHMELWHYKLKKKKCIWNYIYSHSSVSDSIRLVPGPPWILTDA